MSTVVLGPQVRVGWGLGTRGGKKPPPPSLTRAAAALLPPSSHARRWLEHPAERLALGRSLAYEGTCSLLPLDEDGLAALRAALGPAGLAVEERVETFRALEEGGAHDEAKPKAAWSLLEPTATGYRVWSVSSVVVLAATWPTGGASLINPVDSAKRRFSEDSRLLCAALAADPAFLPAEQADAARALLRASLRRSLRTAVGNVVGVGLVACSVAAAICTGVGALQISTDLARSIVSGAASGVASSLMSSAGNAGVPEEISRQLRELTAGQQTLAERVRRLEEAVRKGEGVEPAASAVAVAWRDASMIKA